MLPLQPNVEIIFHAGLPVDSSNCLSPSASDSVSILSASDSAWAAPSLRMALVGVEMPGGGGAVLLIWSIRHWQSTDKQIKTRIEELKQFVFQSSERVRSWLGPVKDAGRPGGWDWNERCSTEHVRRDVPASVTLSHASVRTAFYDILDRRSVAGSLAGKKWRFRWKKAV